MTITILRPSAVAVEVTGRGYGTRENAASIALKALGVTVRGSRYYDVTGQLVFVDRDEASRVLVGFRWLVQHANRWFVALPAKAVL